MRTFKSFFNQILKVNNTKRSEKIEIYIYEKLQYFASKNIKIA